VEGVGTKAVGLPDGSYVQKMSNFSLGTGLGTYGAGTRLTEAREKLLTELDRYIKRYGSPPDQITFDIFGFSRGAMLARHFVNMIQAGLPDRQHAAVRGSASIRPDLRSTTIINPGGNTLEEDQANAPTVTALYPRLASEVRVRFVGLFDSVGSFFLAGNDDEGFINPYFNSASAEFVYQITARDEIRNNFPLTRIVPGGPWLEEETYGAHSDYDETDERLLIEGTTDYYRNAGESADEERFTWKEGLKEKRIALERELRRRTGNSKINVELDVIGNFANFFEVRETKPDLAKVSLKAMYGKAIEMNVPFAPFKKEEGPPEELLHLVQQAKAGNTVALKQLGDDYIHTSHRSLLLAYSNTIGMSPEASGIREVYPNRPGLAIVGSPVTVRRSK
jgi:hypothetical protein